MDSLLRGEELDFLVGFVLVSPHMHVAVVMLLWIFLCLISRVIEIRKKWVYRVGSWAYIGDCCHYVCVIAAEKWNIIWCFRKVLWCWFVFI